MLIQLIFSTILGTVAGTFTGLTPGIHINIVSTFLTSSQQITNPIYLITFITSLAIAHTFIDFIPSILLGCPDTDTELSILPGHELLKKGDGYKAILLSAYGGLIAIIAFALLIIPFIYFIPKINHYVKTIIPYLLIGICLFMILIEKKKFSALIVFTLTGILGLCILNIKGINQPLFPLLSGLFGVSSLILSIKTKTKIPEQKIEKPTTKLFRPTIGAVLVSPLSSFLPAVGSGQVAIIGNLIARTTKEGFLVLLGITNTLAMGISFITFYSIGKTRTGASVAVKELVGNPTKEILILIIVTIILTGIISFFLTKFLAKFAIKKISKINYSKLSTIILIFLAIITLIVSGFFGFSVLIISTLTGIFCINLKVKRTNMMGCLILPTIVYYLAA